MCVCVCGGGGGGGGGEGGIPSRGCSSKYFTDKRPQPFQMGVPPPGEGLVGFTNEQISLPCKN